MNYFLMVSASDILTIPNISRNPTLIEDMHGQFLSGMMRSIPHTPRTKDGEFNRTKVFNLADLLEIVLDDSVYYKKRLLDVGNGRMGAFRNTKSGYILKKENTITENHIVELGELKFLVASETNPEIFYHVDMASGFCE